ncbi:MAG: hypothetical protein A3H72_00505 [Candidatus Doudnabacteria bacterium RIFCSPLOWO2_02_FULL_48_8]|uniref:Uncharacterized protein n=1 Tax=Candidatus Doudnabacteria bacterium RIFCSPHIGHO2_01_FULL_46_24 TaxID=1817825 RepID=A0A1F5NVC2_9BACT|nr:MAG: hypothetical protein A2720_03495 [Candidatus Doudnabacteria bacterium RIFCSPHIGHO2_01_FULL_46_24]OGE95053.1 MAG: hypothetical protein A3H72_00505 [Candidatus Doudnabacteria bacterium RIFCSPLOWO2_02_FULL_48_8]OGE95824.1 MAG: hypothetical protein A3E98_03335 [Candidatus Doudnabacteria bacterium RIFCSPHIGHO2_12_FULL_48_11]
MFSQIDEPIDVIAKFSKNKLTPVKFLWGGREYLVRKINLTWSSFEGRSKIYYFAVSDNVNCFKLRFDTESLRWTLLESYVE